MQVVSITNKILNSITYILSTGNNKDCWLVDCGDIEKVFEQGWNVNKVALTHSHADHIYGLNKLLSFPMSNKELALISLTRLKAKENDGFRILCGYENHF